MSNLPTGLTFRRFRDEDQDAVWSVFADCTAQLGFELDPWDHDMRHISDAFLSQDGEFIVSEHDGRVVAFAGFARDGADRAEVRRVGVHPDVQQRGFGLSLMLELEARARDEGITALHLDTSISQIAAQRLYSKCGYQEVRHVVLSGVECITYEKSF
jgi:ribosomal protein S18 acetylase RimI-like enzyme